MALTVTMPQLGESVTEGTITQWLKQPGDAVERYESIAEVTTDKVNAEIPSPVAGTMGEHLVTEGTVVSVDGGLVAVPVRSVCTHGDTPDAVRLARAVRAALEAAGVTITPFVAHGP